MTNPAVAMIVAYTILITVADGITKALAKGYAAPQMYAFSAVVVVTLCLVSAALAPRRPRMRTLHPVATALRAGFTVLGTICFFLAFRLLPFADVFVFVGLMPIFAALLAGPVLGESVSGMAWIALVAGFAGLLILLPDGGAGMAPGHLLALGGAGFGTVSIVLARYIGRSDRNALAQVFFPNLAILAVMGAALPFVWQPMPLADLALTLAYGIALFAARWLLVTALQGLPAHAVTSLMKMQFVWMVLVGGAVFGEWPGLHTYLGAAIVIASGLGLAYEGQLRRMIPARRAVEV